MSEKCEQCGRFGATPQKFKWPDSLGDPYTLYLCSLCWKNTMLEWDDRKRKMTMPPIDPSKPVLVEHEWKRKGQSPTVTAGAFASVDAARTAAVHWFQEDRACPHDALLDISTRPLRNLSPEEWNDLKVDYTTKT